MGSSACWTWRHCCYTDSILDNDEPRVLEDNARTKAIAAAAGFRVTDTEAVFLDWMAEHPGEKVRDVIWLNPGDRHPGISTTRRVADLIVDATSDWLDTLAGDCAPGDSDSPPAEPPAQEQ